MSCNSDIQLIERIACKNSLATYDSYDIWKTKPGLIIKQLYYKNKYIGILPAGLLTFFDQYINNRIRFGYKKQEFPIVRAQAALSLINLYHFKKKHIYLIFAKKHIDWLLNNYSKGYSGYCWGLSFNWVYSANKIYNKNVPFSTHSPYPLEAMVKYYEITKDKNLIEPIKSVFYFLENDIKIMRESKNILVLSYSTEKDRIVTNANSYLMYMYSLMINFFPEKKEYIENKVIRIFNFLVSVQNKDGSWLYSPFNDDTFIDCFHSVFVLKNIIKTNSLIKLRNSNKIVSIGYRYIIDNFIDYNKFLFRRFTRSNKISIQKYDLYDNAEILNLASMLNDRPLIIKLLESIKINFIRSNSIASNIDVLNTLKNYDHLRWAVLPYIYALSNIKKNKQCVEF